VLNPETEYKHFNIFNGYHKCCAHLCIFLHQIVAYIYYSPINLVVFRYPLPHSSTRPDYLANIADKKIEGQLNRIREIVVGREMGKWAPRDGDKEEKFAQSWNQIQTLKE